MDRASRVRRGGGNFRGGGGRKGRGNHGRGGGGRGRFGEGDSRASLFHRLMKDPSAAPLRSKPQAMRFLQGMDSFDSKPVLLSMMVDERNQGRSCLEQIVGFLDTPEDVTELVIPLLQHALQEIMSRPLYRPLRDRYLHLIYGIPHVLTFLNGPNVVASLDQAANQLIACFLLHVAKSVGEARHSQPVRDLAETLRDHGSGTGDNHNGPVQLLCIVLMIPPSEEEEEEEEGDRNSVTSTKRPRLNQKEVSAATRETKKQLQGVCWYTDSRPPGGRHDNDSTNYRDIAIVPTAPELQCQVSPYLPLASGENTFIRAGPVARLLDSSFRLLREDSVSSMRQGITERKSPWHNARIIDVDLKEAHSLSFRIQVDPPNRAVSDWSRAKLLLQGSVVAFLDTKNNHRLVRTGTISIRKEEWLRNKQGPCIGVEFDDQDAFQESIREMSRNHAFADEYATALSTGNHRKAARLRDRMTTYELVEISKSFFSYKSILKALQQMDQIPFSEELLTTCWQPHRVVPAKDDIGNNMDDDDTETRHREVNYMQRHIRFPQDDNFRGHTCDLLNLSSTDISDHTSLDESQALAVVHALTRRVALIQGPPGTGKTFIGGLLAQLIRLNSDETILCVCFTNHALDQFLEHMLDFGEKRIVRLGGRSKSERIASFQIGSLAAKKAQRHDRTTSRIRQVDAQMHGAREQIGRSLEDLEKPVSWNTPSGGVKRVLEDFHPVEFEYLRLPGFNDEEDGFQHVGPNGRPLNSGFLWNEWKNGKEIPQFVLALMDDFPPEMEEFWKRPQERRSEFVSQVEEEVLAPTRTALRGIVDEFMKLQYERKALGQDKSLKILRDARIIGATTSGAARYREMLTEIAPSIVVVEEAGEVLEAHILASLSPETKHLVLIGDHKQLRPKVETHMLSAVSGNGYNLDVSLFERLVLGGLPSATLAVQHRMRPSISRIIREQTYPNLIDHDSVHQYPNVRGISHNLLFIDHDHKEDGEQDSDDHGRSTTTKSNKYEAMMCVEIVRFLLLQGYTKDSIVVLTPYLGQLFKIIGEMKHHLKDVEAYVSDQDLDKFEGEEYDELENERSKERGGSVRCSSVDNYQGEESDIVVISLVRSNSKRSVGFLKEPQRVNVLLSRARHGMILVGNIKTLVGGEGKATWSPILSLIEGRIFRGLPTVCQIHHSDPPLVLSSREEFRARRPNGGCGRKCMYRLECGHVCPNFCHPMDRNHKHTVCMEPCARVPEECPHGHPCTKRCKDKCGACLVNVGPVELTCGHIAQSIRCHNARNKESLNNFANHCKEQVTHRFEGCGHEITTWCGNSRQKSPECPELCSSRLECGHLCQKRCGSCEDGHKCNEKCERNLFCRHSCVQECHSGGCPPCAVAICEVRCSHSQCPKSCSDTCASCVEQCDWECEHQGICPLVCGAPCSRLPCNERCDKKLECGHQCPSLCGEICPDISFCKECSNPKSKERVVDMITFEKYEDHDVDCDPIIVLPCKHFFSVSTLDGLIGIDSAYQRDGNQFTSCLPLSDSDVNEKGKQCPDCRAPIHSIRRYGRIINLAVLRSLERKHLMDVKQALDKFSQIEPKRRNTRGLLKIKRSICEGPMKKVFDACGNRNNEAPTPPAMPLIECLRLLGQSYGAKIKRGDSDESKLLEESLESYEEAIEVADGSQSHRSSATVRICMVRSLGYWTRTKPDLKSKLLEHLTWVVQNMKNRHADDIIQEATELEASLNGADVKEVVRAMNVVRGYDYGGTASDHWYECPNGHPYFIGDCGGAMETSQCIECGAVVGGGGHSLTNGNRRWTGYRDVMRG